MRKDKKDLELRTKPGAKPTPKGKVGSYSITRASGGREDFKQCLGIQIQKRSLQVGLSRLGHCQGAGSLLGCFCISAFVASVHCFESRNYLYQNVLLVIQTIEAVQMWAW